MWQTINQPLAGNTDDSLDATTFIPFIRRFLMKIKLDEPTIPNDIQQKIWNLQVLLDWVDNLRDEILAWYTAELKSYDFRADAQQELFNPGTGTTVEGISELAIMEALSELQIFNEVRKKKWGEIYLPLIWSCYFKLCSSFMQKIVSVISISRQREGRAGHQRFCLLSFKKRICWKNKISRNFVSA